MTIGYWQDEAPADVPENYFEHFGLQIDQQNPATGRIEIYP
ncbi:hypothetical protein [Mucilaginibacter pedocola]|nr:hypothetical protein [Mucilaginibacter pedocola]